MLGYYERSKPRKKVSAKRRKIIGTYAAMCKAAGKAAKAMAYWPAIPQV